jgi:hypothetical protein
VNPARRIRPDVLIMVFLLQHSRPKRPWNS